MDFIHKCKFQPDFLQPRWAADQTTDAEKPAKAMS